MKTILKSVLTLSTFVILATGCSSAKHDAHQSHRMPNGDIQEKTASVDVLPDFLKSQKEDIRMVYSIAAKSVDVLQWIPCYCGCGESAGHKSNENCFVKQVNNDGSIVWDDHGTRCNVCMRIAVEAAKMKKDGKTVKEIREAIDQEYKNGYAKPTNTPMPL